MRQTNEGRAWSDSEGTEYALPAPVGGKEQGMDVIESSADGVTIVEPHGRIDTISAKPFGDRVVELIRSGTKQILIDLRHIQYISSAGFRALLIAHKQSAETKSKLV